MKPAARCNNATAATYPGEGQHLHFAEGSFRFAFKGIYINGERKGEKTVGKMFKKRSMPTFAADCFQDDIRASKKAIEIVDDWNSTGIFDGHFSVNEPETWTWQGAASTVRVPYPHLYAGQQVLQEPFIEGYEKWNSNSGWHNSETRLGQAMQALSHFSYHVTKGRCVLCDLQGGFAPESWPALRDPVLTDPVILSCDGRYGMTDLGMNGIRSFFNEHRCNQFCKDEWIKPRAGPCVKLRPAPMKATSRA